MGVFFILTLFVKYKVPDNYDQPLPREVPAAARLATVPGWGPSSASFSIPRRTCTSSRSSRALATILRSRGRRSLGIRRIVEPGIREDARSVLVQALDVVVGREIGHRGVPDAVADGRQPCLVREDLDGRRQVERGVRRVPGDVRGEVAEPHFVGRQPGRLGPEDDRDVACSPPSRRSRTQPSGT
jgi:hypothetical protein